MQSIGEAVVVDAAALPTPAEAPPPAAAAAGPHGREPADQPQGAEGWGGNDDDGEATTGGRFYDLEEAPVESEEEAQTTTAAKFRRVLAAHNRGASAYEDEAGGDDADEEEEHSAFLFVDRVDAAAAATCDGNNHCDGQGTHHNPLGRYSVRFTTTSSSSSPQIPKMAGASALCHGTTSSHNDIAVPTIEGCCPQFDVVGEVTTSATAVAGAAGKATTANNGTTSSVNSDVDYPPRDTDDGGGMMHGQKKTSNSKGATVSIEERVAAAVDEEVDNRLAAAERVAQQRVRAVVKDIESNVSSAIRRKEQKAYSTGRHHEYSEQSGRMAAVEAEVRRRVAGQLKDRLLQHSLPADRKREDDTGADVDLIRQLLEQHSDEVARRAAAVQRQAALDALVTESTAATRTMNNGSTGNREGHGDAADGEDELPTFDASLINASSFEAFRNAVIDWVIKSPGVASGGAHEETEHDALLATAKQRFAHVWDTACATFPDFDPSANTNGGFDDGDDDGIIHTCPISQEPFTDPVSLPSGITYERSAIAAWLTPPRDEDSDSDEDKIERHCPVTRKGPYTLDDLVPNRALLHQIETFVAQGRAQVELSRRRFAVAALQIEGRGQAHARRQQRHATANAAERIKNSQVPSSVGAAATMDAPTTSSVGSVVDQLSAMITTQAELQAAHAQDIYRDICQEIAISNTGTTAAVSTLAADSAGAPGGQEDLEEVEMAVVEEQEEEDLLLRSRLLHAATLRRAQQDHNCDDIQKNEQDREQQAVHHDPNGGDQQMGPTSSSSTSSVGHQRVVGTLLAEHRAAERQRLLGVLGDVLDEKERGPEEAQQAQSNAPASALSQQEEAVMFWRRYATECKNCHLAFGILRRQHHCRRCGEIFCGLCCQDIGVFPIEAAGSATSPMSKDRSRKDYSYERICGTCYVDCLRQPPQPQQTAASSGSPKTTAKGKKKSTRLSLPRVPVVPRSFIAQGFLVNPFGTHALTSRGASEERVAAGGRAATPPTPPLASGLGDLASIRSRQLRNLTGSVSASAQAAAESLACEAQKGAAKALELSFAAACHGALKTHEMICDGVASLVDRYYSYDDFSSSSSCYADFTSEEMVTFRRHEKKAYKDSLYRRSNSSSPFEQQRQTSSVVEAVTAATTFSTPHYRSDEHNHDRDADVVEEQEENGDDGSFHWQDPQPDVPQQATAPTAAVTEEAQSAAEGFSFIHWQPDEEPEEQGQSDH